MCGLAGFVGFGDLSSGEVKSIASEMGRAIKHRGPDDFGILVEPSNQLALIHRRLSIVDLTVNGSQPMASGSERYIIVFNGEIYNHLDLREKLPKLPWRGHSDTETLLACFEVWGIDKTLKEINGMFAFALWDELKKTLYLARDRIGEKPIYYGWQNGVFLFGSELKSLKLHPAFKGEIDRDVMALQIRHGYIPAPYSIYKDIYKLPAGSLMVVDAKDRKTSKNNVVNYWSLKNVISRRSINDSWTDRNAVDQLEAALTDSVKEKMIADVPLGAFLSGGIDSSLIVSLMQCQSADPIKTYTVGFSDQKYDEAPYARSIASHLGTDHTELYLGVDQVRDLLPKLPEIYDEPFSDSSQIPTYFVSRLASQQVKVSLSGDAGDELFSGYTRYSQSLKLWKVINFIPKPLRISFAIFLQRLPPLEFNKFCSLFISSFQNESSGRYGLERVNKLAELLKADSFEDMYLELISQCSNPQSIVIGATEPPTVYNSSSQKLPNVSGIEQLMYKDTVSYLPDDILVKLDRASMAVSLETRVPFLDERIIELAWTLPHHFKVRDGESKWILRQILYKYIPPNLVNRPKKGFGVPMNEWLRGPLKNWADDFFSQEQSIKSDGYLNFEALREKWDSHISGKANYGDLLWNILMFQAWLEKNKK